MQDDPRSKGAKLYARKQKGLDKQGRQKWALLWCWYETGNHVQQQKRVPITQYDTVGVPRSLTLEEARERTESINAQVELTSRERKRLGVIARLEGETLVQSAYLSPGDVHEFEQRILLERMSAEEAKGKKLLSHWRACKRVMTIVQLDISEWHEKPFKFYDHWKREKVSLSYIKKLIPLLNRWGFYQAKKYKKAFMSLPFPAGLESEKISDSYYTEYERGNESDPMTPAQLEANRNNLKPAQWNWLYLAIWFGLRPKELDSLKRQPSKTTWSIGKNKHDVSLLYVYQSKLVRIPREKRTKHIPCLCPEQLECLKIIESGNFSRPLVKTLKKFFTEYTNCYAGRKGFTNLMLSKGHQFNEVSKWLGHRSLDRSYNVYLDHQNVDEYGGSKKSDKNEAA
ncbi:unnamed protein product [Sphagnum jensenii]|uniref:Tyr recombinase domain-containing protein n=1 Tax=Sphagnum jensenii TaxID=128206 RepID=A0ABP0VCB0_9BRYO